MENVRKQIKEGSVSGIGEFFKGKLRRWKDVEINICVTGDCGVGKSSFINAIRGLKNDDEGAAKADVVKITTKVAVYSHPTNEKIKFWDLPGTGTPNYAEFDEYWKKVGLEKYDTFLILCAGRFSNNDLLLAKKVKSIKKSFFFARNKIDVDIDSERKLKREFNEKEKLKTIRENCLVNLNGFVADDKDVFLISNCETAKWDFDRLTQAILDVLPLSQKESLTLSLDFSTSLSKDLLKRKAEILRGRIWMVAAASATGALIPLPGLSIAVDVSLLTKEVKFYKSQFGLPEENSDEFRRLTLQNQEKVRKISAEQITDLLLGDTTDTTGRNLEQFARFIPLVGSFIAGNIAFRRIYRVLQQYLNELKETALALLDELTTIIVDDMDLD